MQSTHKLAPVGDFYEISNKGEIFAIQRTVYCSNGQVRVKKRIQLSTRRDKDGYIIVSIYFDGKQKNCRVHRLVGHLFVPNPDNKPFINHKNGKKWDNSYMNLEWSTQSENELHAIKYLGKKQPKGEDSMLATKMVVIFPDGEEKIMYGQNDVARQLGLDQAAIWKKKKKKSAHTKGFKFRYAS